MLPHYALGPKIEYFRCDICGKELQSWDYNDSGVIFCDTSASNYSDHDLNAEPSQNMNIPVLHLCGHCKEAYEQKISDAFNNALNAAKEEMKADKVRYDRIINERKIENRKRQIEELEQQLKALKNGDQR